jgi:hypothetical protein
VRSAVFCRHSGFLSPYKERKSAGLEYSPHKLDALPPGTEFIYTASFRWGGIPAKEGVR